MKKFYVEIHEVVWREATRKYPNSRTPRSIMTGGDNA